MDDLGGPKLPTRTLEVRRLLFAKVLGAAIADARKARQVTSETLATKLGITRGTLSTWENGKALPDAFSVDLISKELDAPLDVLFGPTARVRGAQAVPTPLAAGAEAGSPDTVVVPVLRFEALERDLKEMREIVDRIAPQADEVESKRPKRGARSA